ncbi:divalent metal cation transporter [cyanobiont of Ornithocercus magnificus]|nr:divalent metal cation transporter [cyanobiont of Ornithocercus magnificus]
MRKSFGPGILLAAAAIGGSHLVASTRAGAIYGLGLVGIILLANLLKYPFLLIGTSFTAATSLSLLEGYKRQNPIYLTLFLLITFTTGVTNIAAVTSLAGSLATTLIPANSTLLTLALLGFCLTILLFGGYRSLNKTSKNITYLLIVLTVLATATVLLKGPAAADVNFFQPTPWTLEALPFLVALVGWMPCPLDLAAWSSLWIFAQEKDLGHHILCEEIEEDFNLGYLVTVTLAILFLILGAWTMHGTGEEFSSQGNAFANQLVQLYTRNIGVWARPLIAIAAFITMASTTITCLDGYPRSTSVGISLLHSIQGLDTQNRQAYQRWLVLYAALSAIIIVMWPGSMALLLDIAMIVSFITTPAIAWMNFTVMQGYQVKPESRFRGPMVLLCRVGILMLSCFSLLFVYGQLIG